MFFFRSKTEASPTTDKTATSESTPTDATAPEPTAQSAAESALMYVEFKLFQFNFFRFFTKHIIFTELMNLDQWATNSIVW